MKNNIQINKDRLSQSFCLPGGRILAYAEYGPQDGKPVFYFHGLSGSRLEPEILDGNRLIRAGIRLVACDRPGMGGSSFLVGRAFSDWPADSLALADHLGWRKFGVMGVSGGGGYVSACARLIPDRLSAAVIVSGAGRMDSAEARAGLSTASRLMWWIAARSVRLISLFLNILKSSGRDPDQIQRQTMNNMSSAERDYFEKPGRLEAFIVSGMESMRQGTRGVAWDTHLYARPWDFRLEEIRFPVYLFHGDADLNVPVEVARKIAATIPGCQATFYPGEGHISVLVNHQDEIFYRLTTKSSKD